MRFLLDQDVYAITAVLVRNLGHDVATASELGLARASDQEILEKAIATDRVLITRDRHFGALIFVRKIEAGVIYMRFQPARLADVHVELARVLSAYDEGELRCAFIVVESDKHRIRRLK